MNAFERLEHFLGGLFGHASHLVQDVIGGVGHLVDVAVPIVTDLSAIAAKHTDAHGLVGSISKWLVRYQPDLEKVAGWTEQAKSLSTNDILRTAASMALVSLAPGGLASDINLAIELAYSVFKRVNQPGSLKTPAAAAAPAGQ